jgi:hypothetical protein
MDGVAQKQFNLRNMTECLLGERLRRFIDSNAVRCGVLMAQKWKISSSLLDINKSSWRLSDDFTTKSFFAATRSGELFD